jgi:phosphopantothenoylcysteine decarboxylase/phosphopantothenate--cysteine ligase
MLKLHGKGADMIVLNSLRDEGAGFGHDTNKVTLLHRDGKVRTLPLQSKEATASAIVKAILQVRHETSAV